MVPSFLVPNAGERKIPDYLFRDLEKITSPTFTIPHG
jgi:hypothetical protein